VEEADTVIWFDCDDIDNICVGVVMEATLTVGDEERRADVVGDNETFRGVVVEEGAAPSSVVDDDALVDPT